MNSALTKLQYGFVKKAEHFWKGMSHNKTQISPIPPEAYGDRFIKFITGITMSREEAEREKQSNEQAGLSLDPQRHSSHGLSRNSIDRVMDRAEKQAHKSEVDGAREGDVPERTLNSVRSPSAERTNGLAGAILPVVEEVGEAGSTGGRSGRSRDESVLNEKPDGFIHGDRDERHGRSGALISSKPPKDATLKQTPDISPVVP